MNAPFSAGTRPITIAIFAMGGEGGGVLADWIVDLAEQSGHIAQLTSVPGVAQRTGATNYYLELFPKPANGGSEPVMALIPMPGDIDIVIASELMEAGRAVQRGLVTPDRTTLVASTNRVFAMSEKLAMADGRIDDAELLEACRLAARQFHAFDMAAIAEATGSVISAVLFGALAAANVLPFPRGAFEAAIRRGGVGIAPSLAAFTAGFEAVASPAPVAPPQPSRADVKEARQIAPALAEALADVDRDVPPKLRTIVRAGVERTADYQDVRYARLYLDRIKPIIEVDRASGIYRLSLEVARQLALGMAYEDTVRVAELKIRPSRFARVREEVRAAPDQIIEIAEFMHPRPQEIADTMPAGLGRWMLRTGWFRRLLERMTARGKTVKTSSLRGFLLLYAVSSLKPLRPRSLRYGAEQAMLEDWLATVRRIAASNYDLAVEVAAARNLVKGYGDTHERGRTRYDMLMGVLPQLAARSDGALKLAALRKAANADDTGTALDAAMAELKG
jgi:indolepyruvate ferredoxin oxidoreductase beta subunit